MNPTAGAVLLALSTSIACARNPATTPEPGDSAPTPASADRGAAEPKPAAAASDGTRVRGTIIEEGPIGDGACTQKSYRVRPRALDAEPLWIHFENCGGGPSLEGAGLEGLQVGEAFAFEVRPGASPNFGDDPILVAATPLPTPNGPLDLPSTWTRCTDAKACTIVALGCCHETPVNTDHARHARDALDGSGIPPCPVKSACGPSTAGTWEGEPAECRDGSCVLPPALADR